MHHVVRVKLLPWAFSHTHNLWSREREREKRNDFMIKFFSACKHTMVGVIYILYNLIVISGGVKVEKMKKKTLHKTQWLWFCFTILSWSLFLSLSPSNDNNEYLSVRKCNSLFIRSGIIYSLGTDISKVKKKNNASKMGIIPQ